MNGNVELTYTKQYTPYSREEIIEKVSEMIHPNRLSHVLGVEKTAIDLAQRFNADIEKVSIAALLHDYAKEQPDEEMRDMIISENMNLDLLQFGNNIWHGPTGAIFAKKVFDVQDYEILNAIRHHTVGSPNMGVVEQIIYLADFIEPGRAFPGVEVGRKLAKESLKAAVQFEIIHTLEHLLEMNGKIYPKAIDTYNAWAAK